MKRSVVVVSYQPTRWLSPCLASVVEQADQLVVVDNGSAGGEAGAIAGRFDADVVRLDQNTGVAPGMNAGLEAATGEIVALLNDDAIAEPGWLDSAVAELESPAVGAVSPKLRLASRYVEARYQWDHVLDEYEAFLDTLRRGTVSAA